MSSTRGDAFGQMGLDAKLCSKVRHRRDRQSRLQPNRIRPAAVTVNQRFSFLSGTRPPQENSNYSDTINLVFTALPSEMGLRMTGKDGPWAVRTADGRHALRASGWT
jgi:hypothetical protein